MRQADRQCWKKGKINVFIILLIILWYNNNLQWNASIIICVAHIAFSLLVISHSISCWLYRRPTAGILFDPYQLMIIRQQVEWQREWCTPLYTCNSKITNWDRIGRHPVIRAPVIVASTSPSCFPINKQHSYVRIGLWGLLKHYGKCEKQRSISVGKHGKKTT